ncbi:MAG: phosphatase PAP2 family protein [Chloroflexota bacterium]|nr:phosphatase PAP2 family protein [Chloroflexota bacterium]
MSQEPPLPAANTDPPPPAHTQDPLPPTSRRFRYWQRLQKRLSPLQKADSWLFMQVNRMPHPRPLNLAMQGVAIVMNRGDGWLFGLFFVALYDRMRGRAKGWKTLWRFAPVLWLATATVEFPMKSIFRRPRPFTQVAQAVLVGVVPKRHSFPSGHSASAFAGAWLLSQHYPKGRILFYAIALLVGFSRIYLGAHYPSDVLAGALSGMGLAALYRRLFRRGGAL